MFAGVPQLFSHYFFQYLRIVEDTRLNLDTVNKMDAESKSIGNQLYYVLKNKIQNCNKIEEY